MGVGAGTVATQPGPVQSPGSGAMANGDSSTGLSSLMGGNTFFDQLAFLAAMFPQVADFISSPRGGIFLNQMNANEQAEIIEEIRADIDESNRFGFDILTRQLGVGSPTRGMRLIPGVEGTQLGETGAKELQRKLEAGETLTQWEQYYVERTPLSDLPPSVLEQVRTFVTQGIGQAQDWFDPEASAAQFGEDLATATKRLEALPGEVAAATRDVQGLYGEAGEYLEAGAAGVAAQYGGLRAELRTGAADLAGGYEDILGRARGLVSTLGEAERQDINRRFGEAGTEMRMELASRGVGGGTIESSLAAGVERERSTALLGLEEQTTRQRLGVEQTFGLPALSAQERLLGAGINLGTAGAGAAERFVGAGTNVRAQQAGALQFGNQLYAGTALNAAGQLINIGAGQYGARERAGGRSLDELYRFGTWQTGAGFDAASLALPWSGQNTIWAPPYSPGISVQPAGNSGYQ